MIFALILSGIFDHTWCIGSKENVCDVLDKETVKDFAITISSGIAHFADGQNYFITLEVKGENNMSLLK